MVIRKDYRNDDAIYLLLVNGVGQAGALICHLTCWVPAEHWWGAELGFQWTFGEGLGFSGCPWSCCTHCIALAAQPRC